MIATRLRDSVRENMALIVFLSAYFCLTVLGNLIYMIPGGEVIGQIAIDDFALSDFQTAGSFGYLSLLVLPFIIAPVVALLTRRFAGTSVRHVAAVFKDFTRLDYIAITTALYGYVIFSFWRVDAVGLIEHGSDVYEAVRSRFELLERLGYWPQMALKSLLIFLACYAFVRAIRGRERFWIAASVINFLLMTCLLVLLNMKWPLLIYYVALALATFSFAPRRPYIGTILVSVATFVTYALITAALLRIIPTPPPDFTPTRGGKRIELPFKFLGAAASAALANSTLLGFTLLNRMAQPYPFYFEIVTREGQKCGTIVDRIERKTNPCQPSSLIYNKMFGDDIRFGEDVASRGTTPQPVHIYGYALGGWSGALIELILTSIVLGLFISIPALANNIAATVTIMGGLTGYFFSQLPFEGPIIYDYGILWWGLLIVAYAAIRILFARSRTATQSVRETYP